MSRTNPCAIPLCPFLREANSYVCKAHSRDAQAGRRILDSVQSAIPKGTKVSLAKPTNEFDLDTQCRLAGLPVPIAEYTFHPKRKWRFDWAFRDQRLGVEVEGGAFMSGGGRHTRGAGFRKDLEKYAEATILGWRIIRVLPEQIENGQALTWCDRALRHLTTK